MRGYEPDLTKLLHHRDHPAASIYLPLQTRPDRRQENRIRWKNAARRASLSLKGTGHDPEPFLRHLEDPVAQALAQPASAGLAVLVSPSLEGVYTLPAEAPELVVVADRFHLKPMLAASETQKEILLLALSLGGVHLFRGPLTNLVEVDLPEGAPRNVGDTLPQQAAERQLQAHSTAARGRTPVIHGHGLGEHREQEDRRRFLRELDGALQPMLTKSDALFAVAGESKLLAEYREVSRHASRIQQELPGGFDPNRAAELLERVIPRLRQQVQQAREAAIQRTVTTAAPGQLSDQLDDMLPAADDGRIDTLFLERGARCWGHYDRARRSVERALKPRAESEDLLDLAAVRTIEHGGRVMMVEAGNLPGVAHAAALLRY